MEQKTKIDTENGKQEIFVTREFDLPLEFLFNAFVQPYIVEQWMGTKVIQLDSKKHGSYQFRTSDDKGNVLFQAHGTIHNLIPNRKIIRTFEMENTSFGIQLEIYDFEQLSYETSKLSVHIIFESAAQREQILNIGMAQGMNMAHNRLQEVVNKSKITQYDNEK